MTPDEDSPARGSGEDRALRRELAVSRLRGCILSISDGAVLFDTFRRCWVEELRGLGIPALAISIQSPSPRQGYYASQRSVLLRRDASGDVSLSGCPWVAEAWERGAAVLVDSARLREFGFNPGVASLVEIPLPGGGSVGVSSSEPDAFGKDSIAVIRAFADVALAAFGRVAELEELRRAKEEMVARHARLEEAVAERTCELAAVHRIRERVWRMHDPHDIKHVLLAIRDALTGLSVPFRECGLNIIETGEPGALPTVRSHRMTADGAWTTLSHTLESANRDPLLRIWKAGVPVYRNDLREQDPYGELAGLERMYGFPVRSVLDIPFSHGTLAVNSDSPDAFSAGHVAFLQEVANAADEAFARFNDLTELAATRERIRRSERLESVGQLAGGIAHDFNNVLTVVLGGVEFLKRLSGERCTEEAVRQHVGPIAEASARAAALVRQLLAFSRRQVLSPQVANLNDVVLKMEVLLERILREDIRLRLKLSADLGRVAVDITQFEQVLLNLAANARDAMPDGGSVTVETANAELGVAAPREGVVVRPGRYVMVAVSDTGTGMDRETQGRIFEPFFTTKGEDRGTGLGLSTVYGIVKQSQGYIWVYSEPGRGTTFKVYLPRTDRPTAPDAAGAEPGQALSGSETILLVEDDDLVREMACLSLREYGYQVIPADGPDAALARAAQGGVAVDLIVTDVVMPGMNGRELAKALRARQPRAKVLFMSGYTANVIHHHGLMDQDVIFLPKPFRPADLARKVRETLDGAQESEQV